MEVLFWPNFSSGTLWSMVSFNEPRGWHSPGFHIDRHHGVVRRRLPGESRPPSLPALERQIRIPRTPWIYQCQVRVAYPLVCGLSAVLPALWLWRTRARRRRGQIRAGFEPVTPTTPAQPPVPARAEGG